MDTDQSFFTGRAMMMYGGSFLKALGEAWLHADESNKRKLIAAFPDYVALYGPGSLFYKRAEDAYYGGQE